MKSFLKRSKDIRYLIFGILFALAPIAILQRLLTKKSLFWAIVALILLAYLIIIGIKDVINQKDMPWYQKFNIPILIWGIGLSFFATLSVLIESRFFNLTNDHRFYDFLEYYVWVTLDMVPGLKVNEHIGFKPNVTPTKGIESIVVIAFRGFIIYIFFNILSKLWKFSLEKKAEKEEASPPTT